MKEICDAIDKAPGEHIAIFVAFAILAAIITKTYLIMKNRRG